MFHPSTFAQLKHPPRHGDEPASSAFRAAAGAAVVIRHASAADDVEIARLAALDERELPRGERLIGELAGRIVAAVDIRSGAAIADPFVPTVGIVELLGLRAAQVRR